MNCCRFNFAVEDFGGKAGIATLAPGIPDPTTGFIVLGLALVVLEAAAFAAFLALAAALDPRVIVDLTRLSKT